VWSIRKGLLRADLPDRKQERSFLYAGSEEWKWLLGKAPALNANGVWHHVRIAAEGHRYRVWINGAQVLERSDGKKARPRGRIALAAYAGGVGQCTVYYDNVVVARLD
jgi:hypothetical protein